MTRWIFVVVARRVPAIEIRKCPDKASAMSVERNLILLLYLLAPPACSGNVGDLGKECDYPQGLSKCPKRFIIIITTFIIIITTAQKNLIFLITPA